jgi:hypothetical protein
VHGHELPEDPRRASTACGSTTCRTI